MLPGAGSPPQRFPDRAAPIQRRAREVGRGQKVGVVGLGGLGHMAVKLARAFEELAKKAGAARVVAAFGTVPGEVLFDVFKNRRKAARPSLVYYGDDPKARRIAATLIRDAGFEPLDAGPLKIARYAEPFTLLVARIAYEGKGGPRPAYRFDRFGKKRSRPRRSPW